MKYVSPIFEVEALSTEDIMAVSTYKAHNVFFEGNETAALEAAESVEVKDEVDEVTGETKKSISVSVSFGNLFNTGA